MMTLAQLKDEAIKVNDIEIQWDKLAEDEKYRNDFVHTLSVVEAGIPGLEFIYQQLTAGQIEHEGVTTDTLADACADELFAAYQLAEVYHRYKMISEISL